MTTPTASASAYPVSFRVDYPDRPLNRLTSALRIVVAIPIVVVLETVSGGNFSTDKGHVVTYGAGAHFPRSTAHDPFPAEVPTLVVRLEPRIAAIRQPRRPYLASMDDRYPSTDDHQSVHLDYDYPDAPETLIAGCRW